MKRQEELWAEEFSELFPKAKALDADALAVLRNYYAPVTMEIGRSFQPDETKLETAYKKSFAKAIRESDDAVSEPDFRQLLYTTMKSGFAEEKTAAVTQMKAVSPDIGVHRINTGNTPEDRTHDSGKVADANNRSRTFAIIGGICLIMIALVLLNVYKSKNRLSEIESDPKDKKAFLTEVFDKSAMIESDREKLAFLQKAYSILPYYRIKSAIDNLESAQFHEKKKVIYNEADEIDYWVESEFDESGNLTKETYFNANGEQTSLITYTYDDKNRLIEQRGHGEYPSVYQYEYNENKRIEKYSEGDSDTFTVSSETTYDSLGRVTKRISYPSYEGDSTYEQEYEYDGHSVIKDFYYCDGILTDGYEVQKSSDSTLKAVFYVNDGQLGFTINKEDDAGNIILRTFYRDDDSEGRIIGRAEFDSDGRPLTLEFRYRIAGTTDYGSWEMEQNTYDDRGLLIRKNGYIREEGEQYRLTYSEEYTYDEEERLLQKIRSSRSDRTTETYEYNDTGYHLTHKTVYGDNKETYRWESDYIYIPYQ